MMNLASFITNRRGLFRTAACAAGAALPAAAQETKAPADEVAKLRKALHDAQFAHTRRSAVYLKRLRQKFGPGVVDEVKAVTIERAKLDMEKAPIPPEKRTLEAVKKSYEGWAEDVTFQWAEETPERLKAHVTKCRWVDELKQIGADGDIGFALVCAYDYGYCAGLNPKMKFSRTKTLMQGDDHCDHTYELKS